MKSTEQSSLSEGFLELDILDGCTDLMSLTGENKEYQKLLPNANKAIKRANIESRNAVQRIASVTFDGNIEEYGYSSNESIAKFQKDFNNTLTCLHEENNNFLKLDITAVNSVLSGSISVPISDDIYYQSINIKKNSTATSTKLYNVFFHPKHLLYMLKNSYLMGKSMISKDLFTFSRGLLNFLANYYKASQVNISNKETVLLLYLTKYGDRPINLDKLYSNIVNRTLNFSQCADMDERNITFTEDELINTLENLAKLNIISISNDISPINKTISIIEKVNI